MVLRKPYAFFIKHFKFIHLLLAALVTYSIIRITGVISLINQYSGSNETLLTVGDVERVYGITDFIVPILAIMVSLLLLIVMTMKKKQNKYYAYSTIITTMLLIVNMYGYSTVNNMTTTWVAFNVADTIADIYVFVLIGCIAEVAIAAARATGFNIGRFDFNNDILNLELSEKDNEEVEVVFDFDINDVKRETQKGIRYFKYFIKENKSLFIYSFATIAAIIVLYVGFVAFKNRRIVVNSSKFSSEALSVSGLNLKVNDSYIINSSSTGEKFPENKHLVVLDVTFENNSNSSKAFDDNLLSVSITDDDYYSTEKYLGKLNDLGISFDDDEKVNEKSSIRRIIAFEVPASRLSGKIYVGIGRSENKKYLKINPKKYEITDSSKIKRVAKKKTEELTFENATLKDTKLKVNEIQINSVFKIDYNFCYKDKCEKSIEYLVPKLNSNYDKTLLKLDIDFKSNDSSMMQDFYDLFANFGYIEYVIGNEVKTLTGLERVKSTKNNVANEYYFEVPSDLKNSATVVLGFKIRNVNYRYYIVGEGE